MREIKFRGKRLDNGEWVYGCLTRYSKHMSYIIVNLVENEVYEVSTETIGQYTGLKDKNGVEIYEGSIVRFYPYGSERIEVIGNIYENPELILDEDSICYGCRHYVGGEDGCYPPNICVEGSLNKYS